MALGVALVVGVLLLTLGLRAAMIVAVILPVVSLASLATMNLIGLPIHQMSVTGLIVALGLLVDAGIVMTDEIGQRLRAGMARAVAVGEAVRRLFMPLMASTVTTALSLHADGAAAGAGGRFRRLHRHRGDRDAAVVLRGRGDADARARGLGDARARGRGVLGSGLRLPGLGRAFRASLLLALANPVRARRAVAGAAGPGLRVAAAADAAVLPRRRPRPVHHRGGPARRRAAGRDPRRGRPARRRAAGRPEVRSVTWVLGRSAPAFYYNITGGRRDAPRHAQALVTTASPRPPRR
jgi:hypothetical protein